MPGHEWDSLRYFIEPHPLARWKNKQRGEQNMGIELQMVLEKFKGNRLALLPFNSEAQGLMQISGKSFISPVDVRLAMNRFGFAARVVSGEQLLRDNKVPPHIKDLILRNIPIRF